MTTRYYKATDGEITVFRATATRAYQSATRSYGVAFSAKPAGPGSMPAVEITKAEYDALQAAKVERIKCAGGNLKWASAPVNSWVHNSTVEG